jgi:hypothetical protein
VTAAERAALRLRLTAGPLGATPVDLADQVTTTADCRIALAAANGTPLDHIDPANGRNLNGENA